MSKFYIKNR